MIKKLLTISLCLAATFQAGSSEYVTVSSRTAAFVIKADKGTAPVFEYFGPVPVSVDDVMAGGPYRMPAYPAYGQGAIRNYSIAATHADGNMSLDLAVETVSTENEGSATVTSIRMKDKVYPFFVTLKYRTYPDSDIIEAWSEIENAEKKTVVLRRFDSAALPVRMGNVWSSTFHGSWADECRIDEQPLTHAALLVDNRDGVRNSQTSHGEIMLSLDGRSRENEGIVIGAAICYTGNYQLRVAVDSENHPEFHVLYAGIDPNDSAYPLAPKEKFVTPVVAFAYSDEGRGGVTRSFHDWARAHRMIHGNQPRMVLLNSWEGVYFDVNEPKMEQMMKDIKSMGGELFVMDDGWFGQGQYRRLDDKCGLGDWTVDRDKLPNGVPWLVSKANENGIKFGIWIEPEMANTASELYTKHPDWIINAPGRDVVCGRGGSQVVLDLGNPAVQDYVFSIVDNLKKENPDLAYIKWDSNMNIRSHGSASLKSDEQSKLYINFHRGLENVCRRIRAKYPDMVIQACASGGGRVNFGFTPYFDEFWTSDNTDALQRIHMQWGMSYFFPSMLMAAHISASPNHQTGRLVPLKYRIDVAMSGRLGMELQPADMSTDEIEECRRAIAEYKSVRNTIQLGDLFRLVSPYDGNQVASLMYVAKDKSEAVFFEWKLEHFRRQVLPRIRMAGLDPTKRYRVTELNKFGGKTHSFEGRTFSGAYLMETGLETLNFREDKLNGFGSCVFKLTAE